MITFNPDIVGATAYSDSPSPFLIDVTSDSIVITQYEDLERVDQQADIGQETKKLIEQIVKATH